MVGAFGGLFIGVGHTIEIAGEYFSAHQAEASTRTGPVALPTKLPSGSLTLAVREPVAPQNIFGASDEVLLEPIGAAAVTRVKINHGGTSLSLRIDFANGARASFKPEQVWPQSDPRREIAAYRMDRLLGIGHVTPSKPIKFTVAELIAAADPQLKTYTAQRLNDEAIARKGELRGMVYWWIPEIRDLWLDGLEMHTPQAQQIMTAWFQIGAQVPANRKRLMEQLATCIVYDVVIDNADRFSGSNTKVSPDQQTLYFLDNTLSFSRVTHGHDMNLRPLFKMQVFPRGLIKKLRELTLDKVQKALAYDDTIGLGPLLTDEEMRAIIARKNHVLEHVDRLIAQFGEEAVLALP